MRFGSETQVLAHKWQELCQDTYRQCLTILTRNIESESMLTHDRGTGAKAEKLAIILACAQLCQSASTLVQLQSTRLPDLIPLVSSICHSCHDVSTETSNSQSELTKLASVCQECAEAGEVLLRAVSHS